MLHFLPFCLDLVSSFHSFLWIGLHLLLSTCVLHITAWSGSVGSTHCITASLALWPAAESADGDITRSWEGGPEEKE